MIGAVIVRETYGGYDAGLPWTKHMLCTQTFPQAKYSLIAELGSPGGVYAGIDSAFFLVANNLVVAYEWQNWEKLADRWIK